LSCPLTLPMASPTIACLDDESNNCFLGFSQLLTFFSLFFLVLFGFPFYLNTREALSKHSHTNTHTHIHLHIHILLTTLHLQRILLSYAGFVRQVPNEDNALLTRTQFYLSALYAHTHTHTYIHTQIHTSE